MSLPETWTTARIGDIVDVHYGKALKKSRRRPGPVPVFGSNGQVGEHNTPLTSEPAIIIGRKGSAGAVNLSPCPCWPIDTTYYIDDFGPVLPEFLAHALGQLRLEERDRSSAIPGLNRDDLRAEVIPVAPLPEQERIVEELQVLLSRVDACRTRLDKIPGILKRFRQSVLAAACSGRLTQEWREAHGDEEWEETTLGSLTVLVTSGSRGWAQYYADSGPLFIRAQNLSHDVLDLTDPAHVQLPKRTEGSRTLIFENDILITITGANVTKTAWVDRDVGEAYVNQHVALVRLANPEFAHYCWLWAVSPAHGRQQLLDSAYGAGKPGLNLTQIRGLSLALPPLQEQREIVRRVDALLKLADAVEKRCEAGRAAVESLTQSILAKAFRGELVPQDPADEPASVLLERIAEERQCQEAPRKKQTQARRGRAKSRKKQ